MTARLVFSGFITALQPLAIKPPETEVAVMPVRTSSGETKESVYIPATTIRGRLRRGVAHALLGDRKRSLDDLYATIIGQTRYSEEKSDYVNLEVLAQLRAANPVTSLFGLGLGLKSRILVSHGIPGEPVEKITLRGVRRDLDADERDFSALSNEERTAWVARANANSDRATLDNQIEAAERDQRKAKKANDEEQLAKIAKLLEGLHTARTKAAALATSAVSIKQIVSHEAAPAGTVFNSEFVVANPAQADLGLVLLALDELSMSPFIGGQQARGCGKMKFEYVVTQYDNGVSRPLCTVIGGGFGTATVQSVDTAAAAFIQASKDSAAAFMTADIDWSLERTLKAAQKLAQA